MLFTEFLRASTLLFGGAATALGVVAVAGADGKGDISVVFFLLGWWTVAAIIGLWLGRRPTAFAGLRRLMARAKTSPMMPDQEPGSLLFNRLWGLAVITVVSGAVAFLLPQVPGIAAGYALMIALAWRRQSAAVAAIEERDGVRFYVERTSPFRPTQLTRTPGLQRFEASLDGERAELRA